MSFSIGDKVSLKAQIFPITNPNMVIAHILGNDILVELLDELLIKRFGHNGGIGVFFPGKKDLRCYYWVIKSNLKLVNNKPLKLKDIL